MEELIVNNRPKSRTSEAIKTVKTNIQFSSIDKDVQTILVTSSIPGEGKSYISSNLAVAFAQSLSKTLVIDCDLRRGRQSLIFDIESKQGLSNLLLDDIDNYANYIRKTKVDNVYILTTGTIPPNPSELLQSAKFETLMSILKKYFDIIILDCPPVNGLNDAIILTKYADKTVIVSRLDKTPMELLEQCKKQLEMVNADIAGVVVNGVKTSKNSYYYDKYYQ